MTNKKSKSKFSLVKNIFFRNVDIIFYLILLSILLINFFKDGQLIVAVDSLYPPNEDSVKNQITSFSPIINSSGVEERFNPFPYYFTCLVTRPIHVINFCVGNMLLTQIIFFSVYFIATYLSMRLFVKEYFNIRNFSLFFFSGLTYAINPISDFIFTAFLPALMIPYGFFPLSLFFFFKSLKTGDRLYFASFICSYILLIFPLVVNMPHFLVYNIVLVLLLIAYPNIEKRRKIYYFLLFVVITLVITSFDIFLIYKYSKQIMSGNVFNEEKSAITSLSVASQYASFTNLFRLMPLSGFHNIFWSNGVANSSRIFYSIKNLPILLSFISFILIVLCLLLNRKKKLFGYLILILLLFIFLAKGLHQPFSNFFIFLFENIPYFSMFRSAPEKFGYGLAFIFSVIFGYSIYQVSLSLKDPMRIGFVIIIIFFSIYIRLPWLNGDIIPSGKSQSPSFYIEKIPAYYSDLRKDYKDNDRHIKILNLPSVGRHYLWGIYDWGYFGTNILSHFVYGNSIVDPTLGGSSSSQYLRDVISYNLGETVNTKFDFFTDNLYQLMGLMSIKELLISNDRVFLHEHYTTTDPMRIEKFAHEKLSHDVSEIKSYGNGKLSRFILSEDVYQELIYSPDRIYTSVDWMVFGTDIPLKNNAIVGVENLSYIKHIDLSKHPEISYERLSSTLYRVSVKGYQTPFLLVFNKEYQPYWEIKNTENVQINSVHFKANEYANAWTIAEQQRSENFDFEISFSLGPYHQGRVYARLLVIFAAFTIFFTFIYNSCQPIKKRSIMRYFNEKKN